MNLKINNDLVVLKLETTDRFVSKAKIVQITILKIFANGKENELKSKLVNPEIPIPVSSTDIHGITDDMVKEQPTFKKYAKGLLDFIGNADILTYGGTHFDIPILREHFVAAGLNLDMTNRKIIDALTIFYSMERRDLKAACYKFLGKKITGRLQGDQAVKGTLAVLNGMINKYENVNCILEDDAVLESPIQDTVEALHTFCNLNNKQVDSLDIDGKVVLVNNVPTLTFGKYKDQPVVPTLVNDTNYYDFIMNKGEFYPATRKVIEEIVSKYKEEQSTKHQKKLETT